MSPSIVILVAFTMSDGDEVWRRVGREYPAAADRWNAATQNARVKIACERQDTASKEERWVKQQIQVWAGDDIRRQTRLRYECHFFDDLAGAKKGGDIAVVGGAGQEFWLSRPSASADWKVDSARQAKPAKAGVPLFVDRHCPVLAAPWCVNTVPFIDMFRHASFVRGTASTQGVGEDERVELNWSWVFEGAGPQSGRVVLAPSLEWAIVDQQLRPSKEFNGLVTIVAEYAKKTDGVVVPSKLSCGTRSLKGVYHETARHLVEQFETVPSSESDFTPEAFGQSFQLSRPTSYMGAILIGVGVLGLTAAIAFRRRFGKADSP